MDPEIENPEAVMDVQKPEATAERKALVAKLTGQVVSAKKHWKKVFDRMKRNMKFAAGQQYRQNRDDDERMKVDIVQRHVNSRTSALYMRNPTIVAKRQKRLDFAMWDEKRESLQQLYMAVSMGAVTPDAEALMRDITEGLNRRKLMKRLGTTLEMMVQRSLNDQQPKFKSQAKQLVVRVLTTGVGYVRVGYQRQYEPRPATQAALYDATAPLATLTRLADELTENESEHKGEQERAMLIRNSLQDQERVIAREGIVTSFPKSTAIIPDKKLVQIEGFVGCDFIVEESILSCEDIEEIYGVDVEGKGKAYNEKGKEYGSSSRDDAGDEMFVVWEIFHKKDGLVYVICEGYDDFLREPAPPEVWCEDFWNHEVLVFNREETDCEPFPRSDVEMLTSLQREINRTMEAQRQHRIASRPLYVARTGALGKEDKKSLSKYEAHDVIELEIGIEQDVNKVIQQLQKANIDPNIYTLDPVYDAINRVSGSQEANLGGTSNSTATESSIAEASRISSLSSNTDDLDEFLSRIADKMGKLHLRETSEETVVRIVGPGAVWPSIPVADLVDELFVEIKAGSSGRPNRDRELANWERATPLLLQLPGIKPDAVVEAFLRALDDSIELVDFYDPSLPSIQARNSQKQVGTGDPASDPNQQGPAGGQNAPQATLPAPGGQPAYPAETPVDNNPSP